MIISLIFFTMAQLGISQNPLVYKCAHMLPMKCCTELFIVPCVLIIGMASCKIRNNSCNNINVSCKLRILNVKCFICGIMSITDPRHSLKKHTIYVIKVFLHNMPGHCVKFPLFESTPLWSINVYIAFYITNMRNKVKGTSLMMSQWRSWQPSTFLANGMQLTDTVLI